MTWWGFNGISNSIGIYARINLRKVWNLLNIHLTQNDGNQWNLDLPKKSLMNKPFASYKSNIHYHIGIAYANLNKFKKSTKNISLEFFISSSVIT